MKTSAWYEYNRGEGFENSKCGFMKSRITVVGILELRNVRIVQTRRNLPCFAVSKTITDVSVITLYDGRLERVCEIHGISGTFVVFIKSGFDPRLLILYVMFVLLLFLFDLGIT